MCGVVAEKTNGSSKKLSMYVSGRQPQGRSFDTHVAACRRSLGSGEQNKNKCIDGSSNEIIVSPSLLFKCGFTARKRCSVQWSADVVVVVLEVKDVLLCNRSPDCALMLSCCIHSGVLCPARSFRKFVELFAIALPTFIKRMTCSVVLQEKEDDEAIGHLAIMPGDV